MIGSLMNAALSTPVLYPEPHVRVFQKRGLSRLNGSRVQGCTARVVATAFCFLPDFKDPKATASVHNLRGISGSYWRSLLFRGKTLRVQARNRCMTLLKHRPA